MTASEVSPSIGRKGKDLGPTRSPMAKELHCGILTSSYTMLRHPWDFELIPSLIMSSQKEAPRLEVNDCSVGGG